MRGQCTQALVDAGNPAVALYLYTEPVSSTEALQRPELNGNPAGVLPVPVVRSAACRAVR